MDKLKEETQAQDKAKKLPACICLPSYSVAGLKELVARRKAGQIDFISTGLASLDEKLDGGFEATQFIVLAARPGAGKSTLAQQIAEYVAEMLGITVLFLALEVGNTEFVRRSATRRSGVPMRNIKKGNMDDAEYAKFLTACSDYDNLPLYTAHADCNDPKAINETVVQFDEWLEHNSKPKIGMIVVDYLQLMTAKGASRVESVGEISRSLKKLAQTKQIPVLALAQMNREIEKRVNKRPLLSDLRESGALEQDANIVIFISRDDEDDQPNELKLRGLRKVEIIIAKNRDGEVCDIDMIWDPSRLSFIEPDPVVVRIIEMANKNKSSPAKAKKAADLKGKPVEVVADGCKSEVERFLGEEVCDESKF